MTRVLYQRKPNLSFIPADVDANMGREDYLQALNVLVQNYKEKFGWNLLDDARKNGFIEQGEKLKAPFLVWNPARDMPTMGHETKELAIEEAKRLAGKHPVETFKILGTIYVVSGRKYYPCAPEIKTEVKDA